MWFRETMYLCDVTVTSPMELWPPNFAQIWIRYSFEAMQSLKFVAFTFWRYRRNCKEGATLCPPSALRETQCKRHINCDPWLTHVLKTRIVFMFFPKFINVFVVPGSRRRSWLHLVWFQKIKASKIKNWHCWNQTFF